MADPLDPHDLDHVGSRGAIASEVHTDRAGGFADSCSQRGLGHVSLSENGSQLCSRNIEWMFVHVHVLRDVSREYRRHKLLRGRICQGFGKRRFVPVRVSRPPGQRRFRVK